MNRTTFVQGITSIDEGSSGGKETAGEHGRFEIT